MRATTLPLIAASALLVAACGSDAPESDDGDRLPDADTLIDDAAELGITPLALALDRAATAVAYRVDMAMGMDMNAFGQELAFEADLDRPMMRVESDADGEQHAVMDLGPMLEASTGATGVDVSTLFDGDLTMEIWQSATTVYLDVSGFGDLMATPGSPFTSERFSLDLTRLGAIGGPEVAAALSGQTAPDPVDLAETLGEVLTDAAGDGSSYSGTITFMDYARAVGQDPAAVMGGATGFDLGGGDLGADVLALYDGMEVDVEVTLAGGAVDLLTFRIDLAPLFTEMMSMFGDLSADEAPPAEFEALFDDLEMSMTMLFDYDLDADVEVTMPSGDFSDATAEFERLFADSLGA